MAEELLQPVKLKPIATPRMWGGDQMKPLLGATDVTEPIGEYWLASAHPSATSLVETGPLAGLTLAELTERFPNAYLGVSPQPRFPLLVKLIEARSDLSVQVHPDDSYAMAHEHDYGKTEAWYILDATNAASVVYGHRFGSRDEYIQAVKDGRVPDFLTYRPIHPGDLVFVPARTLHALLAGTILIEVQQTSDVTYRVYDWDRVDASGQPRQLHVDKAADVLLFGLDHGAADTAPLARAAAAVARTDGMGVKQAGSSLDVVETLVECPLFRIDRVHLPAGERHELACGPNPTLMVGVSGLARLATDKTTLGRVGLGDTWLLPCGAKTSLYAEDALTALCITY